ncbi:MAG: HI0074 family nucleotidyltransferase substrate-binding subunit [Bdellovibrionales bacterium]
MSSKSLSFQAFSDALGNLGAIMERELDDDDVVRDAAIQRFEYSVELSWKTLKRFLKIVYAIDEGATRELYRLAERHGLIADHKVWFRYLDARNATSHTYNAETAQDVYDSAKRFLADARLLLSAMEAGYDRHCAE